MNRSRAVHLMVVVCCFVFARATAFGDTPSNTLTSVKSPENPGLISDPGSLPKGMADLIQASRLKYLEGSALIKAGDSEKARECFDKSVDMLLHSEWDLPSTAVLNRYFQDLIHRIQEDESKYLQAFSEESSEEVKDEEVVEDAVIDELDNVDLMFPLTIDPSIQDAIKTDLAKTKYEIPITMNDLVAKSLDYWLNRGRKYFDDGLVRSGKYRPIIERIFREESIPLDLMYLAQVESLFKPHALSKAKAKGIWQFEKATAIRYGLKVTRDVDERSDPEKSTRAAARYLNDLFAMFKDWNLVLAAYNWGEGKVQRLIKNTGLNDFWDLVDLRKRVPEETKNHVPLIQASVILGRNPQAYGFSTKLDPPLKYTEVSVSKPIDLRSAAKVLRTSIDELKKLNPSLRGMTTPANYPNFQLKVPSDSDPDTHDQLATLPTAKVRLPAEIGANRYKVKRGDSLGRIAAKYNITVAQLKSANKGLRKKLRAGTWIRIPAGDSDDTQVSKKATSGKAKKAVKSASVSKKAKSSRKVKSAGLQAKKRGSRVKTASLKRQLEKSGTKIASK